jgi:osmotically-inducible protein OsmY
MKPLPEEVIKKNIIEQLTWDDTVNANNVNIEIEGNTVYLNGTVNSYIAKLSAARDTLQVARGYNIVNHLSVEFHPHETVPSDKEITENIQSSLKWNSNINPVNLQVGTENGKVKLSGSVSTSREKFEAESIANSTKGVVDVENMILVKPTTGRADNFIENDIKGVFERSALVDEDKIHIAVDNGVVHLTGSVADEPIKNEIYNKALYTNGVVDVINDITVG